MQMNKSQYMCRGGSHITNSMPDILEVSKLCEEKLILVIQIITDQNNKLILL